MKRKSSYRTTVVWWAMAGSILLASDGTARADFTFGEPVNLGPQVNGPADDWGPSLSPDGAILLFGSNRPGGYGNMDLYMATRFAAEDDWGVATNLGATVNSSARDLEPDISADGLQLYFESRRSGGFGYADIWVSKRTTKDDDWEAPENLGPLINTSDGDGQPSISSNGLELYFSSGFRGEDLFVATRASISDDWGIPVRLEQVNAPGYEWCPNISSDGRVLVFGVSQTTTSPGDIWMAIRDTISGDWNPPVRLGASVNTSSDELSADISPDGRALYFESKRPGGFGGYDLWQAPIIPIVDFNADGAVDLADLVLLIDNWGADNTPYDIGPMPWGDGVVDVQDLKVFIAEWEKENPPLQP